MDYELLEIRNDILFIFLLIYQALALRTYLLVLVERMDEFVDDE